MAGYDDAGLGGPGGGLRVADSGFDLVGQRGDQVRSGGQVGAPQRVFPKFRGDSRQPGQVARAGVPVAGVVEPPIQDGGPIVSARQVATVGCGLQLRNRIGTVCGEQ